MANSTPLQLEDLLAERQWLVSLSRHLVLDAHEAEDVAQETLIRALRQSDKKPPERLRGWLAATARHVVLERRRGHGRRVAREKETATPDDDGGVTPEVALARVEFRSKLAQLVMKLDEAERTAIALRYFEGLSTNAIAERTGVPPGTVRQRISRGVGRLRGQLDRDDAGDGTSWLAVATGIAGPGEWAAAAAAAASAPTGWHSFGWAIGLFAATALGALTIWMTGILGGPDDSAATDSQLSGIESPSVAVVPQDEATAPTEGPARAAIPKAWSPTPGKAWVRVVDAQTLEPAEGVRWAICPTGSQDTGGVVVFSTETDNPEPYAEGVTGPGGIAEFVPPDEPLVHFFTHRDGAYARVSVPLRLSGDQADPSTVHATRGHTATGRVLDDRGEPIPALVVSITNRDFDFEYAGKTDAFGRFTVPNVQDFPRAFKVESDDSIAPERADDSCLAFSWPSQWDPTSKRDTAAHYERLTLPVLSSLNGSPPEHTLGDIVIPRLKTFRGRVIDSHGAPVEGALVTTDTRFRLVSRGMAGEHLPGSALPWELGGRVRPGEAMTAADGSFEIRIKGTPLLQESVMAVSQFESKTQVKLPKIGPGEVSEPVILQLPDASSRIVQLVDPQDPDGKLRWFRALSPRTAALTVRTKAQEAPRAKAKVLLPVSDSGEVQILGSMLGPLPARAILQVTGYEPAELYVPASNGTDRCILTRRPSVEVTVNVLGEPLTPWIRIRTSTSPPKGAIVDGRHRLARHLAGRQAGAFLASRAPIGQPVAIPRAEGAALWVCAQLVESDGEPVQPVEVRGPFDPLTTSVTVEIETLVRRPMASKPRRVEGPKTKVTVTALSDSTGEPLGQARLRAAGLKRWRASDEEGRIQMEVEGADATFHLQAEGFCPREIGPVSLKPDGDVDLGVIRLEPLRRTAGRLMGANGEPLREPRQIRFEDPVLGWQTVTCSAEGTFTLGTTGDVPTQCRVSSPAHREADPLAYGRAFATVPLRVVEAEERLEVRVPRWIDIEVEVSGLGPAVDLDRRVIAAESVDGQVVWLQQRGLRADRPLFCGVLPTGTWVVRGEGPITVTPHTCELTPEMSGAPVLVEVEARRNR